MRRHFCELGPLAWTLAVLRCHAGRVLRDRLAGVRFAETRGAALPVCVYVHASLIRRRLGNVDMRLQENKAVNLALAAPRLDGILIRPGETFSFWRLVGACTAEKGYREGLVIRGGAPGTGVGGGMCQMTNLIHWMALHSELTIAEQHHHDQLDLFPDYGRQIPFGTGTSVACDALDYRLYNGTARTYQLRVRVDGAYLRGELRADGEQPVRYHVHAEDECFVEEPEGTFRCGRVIRTGIDRRTGATLSRELLRENHARVMY